MEFTKEARMGSAPIGKLMISLSIPSIIAQVINVLYNIVDRIYIGHIPGVGSTALTGVGLTFPILMLISAFSTFASMGGSSLASIQLGRDDRKKAEEILGCSIWTLIVFTIMLMIVFYAFQKPFLYIFGASKETIPYAVSYLSIYLAGTIFVELALGLNTFIIVQGRPGIAMWSILLGAFVNIALDPLFIFVFKWGVKGAAIATILSQLISAIWNVWFLCCKESTLKIRLKYIKYEKKIVGRILALGVSPFTMRATECLINIVMNRQLQIYGGDLYVGSMTIIQSVMMFMYSPITGFTLGVQPVISYNFGAKKFDRVRKFYHRMNIFCFVYGLLSTGLEVLFPAVFARFFTTDMELVAIIKDTMPIFLVGMLVFGLQEGIQATFIALGQAKVSLFIAMLRKAFLLVPLAFILPHFCGIMGVYYAEPISDILSVTTAATLFCLNINRILSKRTLSMLE